MRYTTSGTTGKPKVFDIDDALMAARVARLDTDRGLEFAALKSLYCEMADGHATQDRYKRWIEGRGGKFYGPQATVNATIALFLSGAVDGIIASPNWLLEYACRVAGKVRLKYLCATGAMMSRLQSQYIRERLGDNLFLVYGAGETDSISQSSAQELEAMPGYVGKPYPGIKALIVGGEVLIKSPTMVAGYVDPKMTAAKFSDGWFRTGDKGRFADDGAIVLDGRL